MDNNQVKVTVYGSGDNVLYESTLFGLLREFGSNIEECIRVTQGAAYIRVDAPAAGALFDVEAPRRE